MEEEFGGCRDGVAGHLREVAGAHRRRLAVQRERLREGSDMGLLSACGVTRQEAPIEIFGLRIEPGRFRKIGSKQDV